MKTPYLLVLALLLLSTVLHADGGAVGHSRSAALQQLTDEEKIITDNFVHEEALKNEANQKCAGNDRICQGKSESVWLDMGDTVAKAYAMIMGVLPQKFTKHEKWNMPDKATDTAASPSPDAAPATPTPEKKKEEYNDYCRYIPTATETIATTMWGINTATEANSAPSASQTEQQASLYKATRVHSARANTAKVQTAGWGTATACYGAMVIATKGDYTAMIKAGATALLTGFFIYKLNASIEARDKTREIANSLQGKGHCNPVTEKECYCSQASTENDPQYCLPQILAKRAVENRFVTTCITNDLRDDPNCSCLSTNSCFNKKLDEISTTLDLGNSFSSKDYSALSAISSGGLSQGQLDTATAKAAAMSKKSLAEIGKLLPQQIGPMSAAQKSDFENYKKLGAPANLAYKLATTNVPASEVAKYRGAFNGSNYVAKDLVKNDDRTLNFASGSSHAPQAKRNEPNYFQKLLAKNNQQKFGATTDGNVLNFQDKARINAEINKTQDRPIFEIISHRYQLTSPKRLELAP